MTDQPLIIGANTHNVSADSALYVSDYNFAERQTIFWDPDCINREFASRGVTLSSDLSASKASMLEGRLLGRNESMVSFLRHGGDLIIILRDANTHNIKLNDLTVLKALSPYTTTGSSISPVGTGDLLDCLVSLNNGLRYTAATRAEDVTPLLRVPNSGQIVGGYELTDWGGMVVFLPAPSSWAVAGSNTAQNARTSFLNNALKLPNLIRSSQGIVSDLPTWAEGFRLPAEERARKEIDALSTVISDAEHNIDDEREVISALEARKYLFTASGNTFEAAVLNALETIGIQAVEGVRGEADTLARIGETVFAIENKGLKGPCKRKNVNQCNGWVSHCETVMKSEPSTFNATEKAYAEKLREIGVPVPESDEDPACDWAIKGLLIINTHCEKLLSERDDPSEPAFNDTVIEELKRRGFCALTGLQLLGMMLAAEGSSDAQERVAQILLDTKGVYPEFNDWRSFLVEPVVPDS